MSIVYPEKGYLSNLAVGFSTTYSSATYYYPAKH